MRHSLMPAAPPPPPPLPLCPLTANLPSLPRVGRLWRRKVACPLARFPSRARVTRSPTDTLLPAASLSPLPLSQGASPWAAPAQGSGPSSTSYQGGRTGSRLPPALWPKALPLRHRWEWKLVASAARDAPGAPLSRRPLGETTDVHVGSRYRPRLSLHTEETFSVAGLLLAPGPTSDVWLSGRAAWSCFTPLAPRAWGEAAPGPAGHRPGPGGHPGRCGQ